MIECRFYHHALPYDHPPPVSGYTCELMKRHRGATSIRIDCPDDGPLGLSVSASRRDGDVHLTLVNPKHDAGLNVACPLPGVTPSAAPGVLLHHADWNVANTFEAPDTIVPKAHPVEVARGAVALVLPPLSVASVTVRI